MANLTDRERLIAQRWQRRDQVQALSPTLDSAYPIEDSSSFDESLKAIDEAEVQVWGNGADETNR